VNLHPLLQDPEAVFFSRRPVLAAPTPAEFREAAEEALAAMGFALAGQAVVLKPNVTSGERFADPDSGIGTHPAFVGGIARYMQRHGARPGSLYVVEDPHGDDTTPCHWRGTGYLEMAEETGAELVSTVAAEVCVERSIPDPLVHASRRVSRHAVAPDTVLISVPKLKTHNLGITTLCLKNLMGLVYVHERHYCSQAMQELDPEGLHRDQQRHEWMDAVTHERWQEGLARRLVDTAHLVPPQFNIIEGVVGRDGTGFRHGENYALGWVIAGVNMVAVDSVASYLMGFDPASLITLRVAAEAGLGTNDLSRIAVYSPHDGELAPCADLAAWRAPQPFRVIRGIMEEGEPLL